MTQKSIYEKKLNPSEGDLKTNLIAELRSYFKLSSSDEEIYEKCKKGTELLLQEWKASKIDPKDQAAVTAFYSNTQLYCYELLALEIDAPEHRQKQLEDFVTLLKTNEKQRGLDYGSGIGTLGVYFNRSGLVCDFADVSETNLKFIRERLQRRGITEPRLVHLLKEEAPKGQYDFVTAFDVIEHVTDPMALLHKLIGHLREDGLLIFNVLCEDEEDTPHLLRDPDLIRKNIRGLGMTKVTSIGEFKIYRKVKRPQAMNHLIHAVDSTFWSVRDKVRTLNR